MELRNTIDLEKEIIQKYKNGIKIAEIGGRGECSVAEWLRQNVANSLRE